MGNPPTLWFALRLWGDELVPEAITAAVGLQPTSWHHKGFQQKGRDGRTSGPRPVGMWSFRREMKTSFENEFVEFLDCLSGIDIGSIPGVETASLELHFEVPDGKTALEDYAEFRMSPETMRRLAELGLDVTLTIS